MYSLTEQVMPLFRPAGFKKGDLVDLNQIRTVLIEYGQKQVSQKIIFSTLYSSIDI
jgi:hypothetical protein